MAKKDKTKGKAVEATLSKKERKALERREAELAAKLAKAEAKAKSKAKSKRDAHAKAQKKGKTKGAVAGPTVSGEVSESGKHPALEHLDRIATLQATKADKTLPKSKRRAAEIELEQLRTEGAARIAAKDAAKVDKTATPLDAETAKIKARVAAKVQARNIGIDIDAVDLTNADAVVSINGDLAAAGIELTLEHIVPKGVHEARMPDALPGESESAYQIRKLGERKAERDEAPAEAKAVKATKAAIAALDEATKAVEAQVVEQVETDRGRIFEAGAAPAEPENLDPAEPEAPPIALTDDGKRYLITRPDGTEARYTRATTYIDGLEHTGGLEAWKLRTLLEGIVVDTEATLGERDHAASLVGQVAAAVHDRDVAIAKLNKADRKGKLDIGERGLVEAKIAQAFKATVDNIATEALDLGGVHAKANIGTNLHKLTEVADEHGIEHVRMLEAAGTITPSDLADIEAYVATMSRLGLKVIETEAVVVNDELQVAGTLDRIVQVPGKLLGRARGAKVVADIKTGSMEYGIGKVSMQTCVYATAEGYEHGKPERRNLGVLKPTTVRHPGPAPLKKDKPLKRDGEAALEAYEAKVAEHARKLAEYHAKRGVALLIHLPQGEARCTVHLIDLNIGAHGLEVVKAVRAWRNEGKRAVDLKADLAALETEAVTA